MILVAIGTYYFHRRSISHFAMIILLFFSVLEGSKGSDNILLPQEKQSFLPPVGISNRISMFLQEEEAIQGNSSGCPDGCGSHGVCQASSNGNSSCVCRALWSGVSCSVEWTTDKAWYSYFIFFITMELFYQIVLVSFAVYELYWTFHLSSIAGTSRWNVVTYILFIIIFAGLIRITEFSVDPFAYRGIIPPNVENVMFNVPDILWIIGGYMLYLYWFELQAMSGIQELQFVRSFRPLLFVLIIVVILVVLPLGLWSFIALTALSNYLFYGVFIITILSMIVLSSISGYKLWKVIHKIYRSTRVNRFKTFLSKISRYIIVENITLIVTIISLAIFDLSDATQQKWLYISLHIVMQTEEFILAFAFLMFLTKQKPDAPSSSSKGDSSNLSRFSINIEERDETSDTDNYLAASNAIDLRKVDDDEANVTEAKIPQRDS